jgi:hypothetical protein
VKNVKGMKTGAGKPLHDFHAFHGRKGNAMPDLPETVSFAAAARLLDLPRSTLDRRLRDGTIPFRQLGRGCASRVFVSELIRLGVSRAAILVATHPATP